MEDDETLAHCTHQELCTLTHGTAFSDAKLLAEKRRCCFPHLPFKVAEGPATIAARGWKVIVVPGIKSCELQRFLFQQMPFVLTKNHPHTHVQRQNSSPCTCQLHCLQASFSLGMAASCKVHFKNPHYIRVPSVLLFKARILEGHWACLICQTITKILSQRLKSLQ